MLLTWYKFDSTRNLNSFKNCFLDEEKKYSTLVDIKKFSQFLNCDTLNLSKILCHVVQGLLLHCSIEEDEYVLHYFLSGIDD